MTSFRGGQGELSRQLEDKINMALRGAPFATLKSFFLHKYYFELMATTTQKIKEKFFTSLMPDFTLEIGWYQEEIYYLKYLFTTKLIYITRQTLFFRISPPFQSHSSSLYADTCCLSSEYCTSFNSLDVFWVSYFYGAATHTYLNVFVSY